jgi:hypothetical protein
MDLPINQSFQIYNQSKDNVHEVYTKYKDHLSGLSRDSIKKPDQKFKTEKPHLNIKKEKKTKKTS